MTFSSTHSTPPSPKYAPHWRAATFFHLAPDYENIKLIKCVVQCGKYLTMVDRVLMLLCVSRMESHPSECCRMAQVTTAQGRNSQSSTRPPSLDEPLPERQWSLRGPRRCRRRRNLPKWGGSSHGRISSKCSSTALFLSSFETPSALRRRFQVVCKDLTTCSHA